MIDFKLYDIPSAMNESLLIHKNMGATISTIHCSSDYTPLNELSSMIAGVTILSSLPWKIIIGAFNLSK